MTDRDKVIYSLERCICHVPDACRDCAYDAGHPYNECVGMLLRDALELLKAQEQEIQQLKATHISASGNAIACGVIRGGVTINQKAKEITNIKHVEVFNG